jgi:hypothetical protein
MSLTPYMGLTLPTVGVTTGPLYATELNAALIQIDQHNHSSGNGSPIPASSLTVDADFAFNGFNSTLLRSTRFSNQSAVLSLSTDLNCLYSYSGNLYYNNGTGTPVRITSGNAIDGSSLGAIGGLVSPAACTYSTVSKAFTFVQNTNIAAKIDCGDILLRKTTSLAPAITISSPTIGSPYSLTLPASLPASSKILTVDQFGAVGDSLDVDNSTLQISTGQILVKDAGITRPKLAAVGQVTSTIFLGHFFTSSLTPDPVDGLSNVMAVTGRPVFVGLQALPQWLDANFSLYSSTGQTAACFLGLYRDTTLISQIVLRNDLLSLYGGKVYDAYPIPGNWIGNVQNNGCYQSFNPCFNFLDTPIAGSYTYTVQVSVSASSATVAMWNLQLITYEL